MLSIVWAKIWCPVDCVAFLKMFAWPCKYHLSWGGALYIKEFEIPKRGVNSVEPFEGVFDAGLQWPALWSFSSDLFVKLVTSPSAGQYLNCDGPSSLFPSLSLCARCRITPDLFLMWFVSSMCSREYRNARLFAFKFSESAPSIRLHVFWIDCSRKMGSLTLY